MIKAYTKNTMKFVFCLLFPVLILSFSFKSEVCAHAATSSSVHATTPSNTEHTIRYFDAEGNLTKIWKGSDDQAQKILIPYRQKMQKMLKQQQVNASVMAPNINRVSPCVIPNDFFDLYNQGLLCFANAGGIGISVSDVYEIESGHNQGYYSYNTSTSSVHRYIGFNTSDLLSPSVTIIALEIL